MKAVTIICLSLASSVSLAGFVAASKGRASSTKSGRPHIESRLVPILHVDGYSFKDLDRNGRLDPYEDWRLSAETRAADLVKRMSLEEKAGLMMVANSGGFVGSHGEVLSEPSASITDQANGINIRVDIPGITPTDRPSPYELIRKLHVRWLGGASGDPTVAAHWANSIQEIAEGTRLGIPVVLVGGPAQDTHRRAGGAPMPRIKSFTSEWPDQVGFGAIADPSVVREFGEIVGAEERAEGIRANLNPMADVATEPRWNRIPGTFGSDPSLDAKLVYAYVQGFQGPSLGPESVLCITKHFPGDGPVKNGFDPHNAYGEDLTYPGHKLEDHLLPFRAAIKAGTGSIMGTYGVVEGVDNVGSNFSRKIMTDLLRKELGFQGIAMTDWLRAMPWGVEDVSQQEREHRLLDAGIDQFGGEHDTSYIINLVRSGTVPESRIDASTARVLIAMFRLGLFEDPYVDPVRAKEIVGNSRFIAAGEAAQRKSIVLLKNENHLLPLQTKIKLYASHADSSAFAEYANMVDSPERADVLLVEVNAPFVNHKGNGSFFKQTHEGTLAYAGSDNIAELKEIQSLESTGKPVIVVMSMERPAVLSEFIGQTSAMLATFGSGDGALAEILFGKAKPTGKLPFDLPRNMESVLAHKEDTAHDLRDPLFSFGFGLTY